MKILKPALLIFLSTFAFSHFVLVSESHIAYAEEEEEEDAYPEPNRETYALTKGHIKALNVRVGFSDCPADETNQLYLKYSDDYLKALIEGKAEGFGLPYNGLADYLKTSSYGNLTMEMGEVIDIQMDNTFGSYFDNTGSVNFYEFDEFTDKLYSKINVTDYDSNNDGAIDVLYLWGLSGDEEYENIGKYGAYTWGKVFDNGQISGT